MPNDSGATYKGLGFMECPKCERQFANEVSFARHILKAPLKHELSQVEWAYNLASEWVKANPTVDFWGDCIEFSPQDLIIIKTAVRSMSNAMGWDDVIYGHLHTIEDRLLKKYPYLQDTEKYANALSKAQNNKNRSGEK